ncbi:MAG: hypothetical protein Q8930_20235 [Bacillota bacterium]|nr:hypothetical protein [Bacillota bacterium]
MALQAWNSSYYVPDTNFGSQTYAVMKGYTGQLSMPPAAQIPVTRNMVTIINTDSGVRTGFNIDITMPTADQRADVWGSPNVQVPVIINIAGTLSDTHISTMNKLGYGYIRFTPTDIYADDSNADNGIDRSGVYTTLYPYNKDNQHQAILLYSA